MYKAREKASGEVFALKKIRMEKEKEGVRDLSLFKTKNYELQQHVFFFQYKQFNINF